MPFGPEVALRTTTDDRAIAGAKVVAGYGRGPWLAIRDLTKLARITARDDAADGELVRHDRRDWISNHDGGPEPLAAGLVAQPDDLDVSTAWSAVTLGSPAVSPSPRVMEPTC